MFIERMKDYFTYNEPIFTSEILEIFNEYSRAYVFRLINKALEQKEILKFDTGIYYIPKKTILGFSTITVEDVVIKKYIKNKKHVFGIYSGLNLMNMFSVTTQVPNVIEIISNKETTRCRKIKIDGRVIVLRKSRCRIDEYNEKAYTIMQLLLEYGNAMNISEESKELIKNYMNEYKISNTDLLSLSNVFPMQATKNLINSGVLYDFTQR